MYPDCDGGYIEMCVAKHTKKFNVMYVNLKNKILKIKKNVCCILKNKVKWVGFSKAV